LKLLIQELQVMNVQMRIITEENVDQLLNLSYQSQNIDKLLGIDHGEDGMANREISEIIENYKKEMTSRLKKGPLNIEPVIVISLPLLNKLGIILFFRFQIFLLMH
jgi:hypothetical protein